MKRLRNYILPVALIILLLGVGCKKDDLTIKPEITNKIQLPLPIIKSAQFSARDLIKQLDSTAAQYLYVNEDSLIHFAFDTSFNAEWSDLVTLNEFTKSQQYDLNPFKKEINFDTTFVDSILVNFIAGQRFDSVTIATAGIDISVTTPDGFTGSFDLSLPGLIKNGQPYVIHRNNFGETFTQSDVLDGSLLKFVHINGNSYLLVETHINAEPQGIPTNTIFSYDLTFTDLRPNLIFGYFGTMDVISQKQSFDFDFFETLDLGAAIKFKAMEVVIGINNYFGIPLGIKVDSMAFFKQGENPVTVSLDSIIIDPAYYQNDAIVPVYDSILINEDIDGLMEGINMAPSSVYIDVVGSINPEGIEQQNFIAADNVLEGDVSVKVPMWFNTSQYARTDTFSIPLDSAQIKLFDNIQLLFHFENTFPFDISGQAYMITEQGDSVGEIFENVIDLMKAPVVDPETGNSLSFETSDQDINLSSKTLLDLMGKGGKNIVLKSYVWAGDFENDIYVKLLTTNAIKITFSFNGTSGDLN